jgi:hypothetical protein
MAPRSSPGPAEVRSAAREVLEANWREPGFTCPNATTYPWLWLWDSCFHSIAWADLGDGDRAISELSWALSGQDAQGFVPHLLYLDGSSAHAAFWGRPATSSITQPPIYGHTVAELARRGVDVPEELLERAVRGLRFLLERRRHSPGGLVEVVHPWESGCDHSPRWDDLMVRSDSEGFDEQVWFRRKGELLEGVQRSAGGAPLWNREFAVGSVAFTALVAFCAAELGATIGESSLLDAAASLRHALVDRWEPDVRTWVDDGPTAARSGRVRTLEALLALLVDDRPEAVAAVTEELCDDAGFGGAFVPPRVHRGEPTFLRGSYWRGPSWPQLDYLMWVALRRAGAHRAARTLGAATVSGAVQSGMAEYWDPDDAAPGGAVPQSWASLIACMIPLGHES